ncbi:DUF6126 family protein [Streptomyces olivaceus]|uniref:DUF6126 family protein n=1 Tax=Streptomyces olivaceus TaxID=47716 RepID=UPI0036E6B468
MGRRRRRTRRPGRTGRTRRDGSNGASPFGPVSYIFGTHLFAGFIWLLFYLGEHAHK